eukprot:TRINITY_DN14382_c0_g1_i1.p1 TRINITY_DN14382_c0_g1~~TRINITY_DN14382_c0_g1_i1.p1  ORF type:complete len:299 (+),score=123.33 TRINITY_DN14382_c0_g1_i1:40-936(+)
MFFFFQAEDGIRDLVRSRGLGDVYKRQDPVLYKEAAPSMSISLQEMLSQPTGSTVPGFDWNQIEPAELTEFLSQLFSDAQEEEGSTNGRLRYGVIKSQLASIDMGAGQSLSTTQMREVLCLAKPDDYGMVSVSEYMPVAAAALRELHSSVRVEVMESQVEPVEDLVVGRTVQELREELHRSLLSNDTNKDNKVSLLQYTDALEGIGLPPEWVEYLLTLTDNDEQGNTSIEEHAIDETVEMMVLLQHVDRVVAQRSQPPPLSKQLLEVFTAADTEGVGLLDTNTIKQCLRDLELSLIHI